MPGPHAPAPDVATATGAGIHRLEVPTPFAVGTVNAYLVEDDPLTLVDSGPNSATAMAVLERRLAEHGYAIADLALIVVTHQHMDHMGLAGLVAERSGAEVACLGLLAPYLEDWDNAAAGDDDLAHDLMLRHGLEPRAGKALRLAGRDLRVLHRPGHSPSDTLLHDEERAIVIGGDHLLSRVSSNALISRPLDGTPDGRRPRPLVHYRASLRATRELDAVVVLGGHGEAVTDHRGLIDARLRRQDQRAGELLTLLRDAPRSAHELAAALWGDVAITQAYLTLSEVLGHLDLLIDAGVVAECDDGAVTRFQAVAP